MCSLFDFTVNHSLFVSYLIFNLWSISFFLSITTRLSLTDLSEVWFWRWPFSTLMFSKQTPSYIMLNMTHSCAFLISWFPWRWWCDSASPCLSPLSNLKPSLHQLIRKHRWLWDLRPAKNIAWFPINLRNPRQTLVCCACFGGWGWVCTSHHIAVCFVRRVLLPCFLYRGAFCFRVAEAGQKRTRSSRLVFFFAVCLFF